MAYDKKKIMDNNLHRVEFTYKKNDQNPERISRRKREGGRKKGWKDGEREEERKGEENGKEV